jgi:hypothetical protein
VSWNIVNRPLTCAVLAVGEIFIYWTNTQSLRRTSPCLFWHLEVASFKKSTLIRPEISKLFEIKSIVFSFENYWGLKEFTSPVEIQVGFCVCEEMKCRPTLEN